MQQKIDMPRTTKGDFAMQLWQKMKQQWMSNSQIDVLLRVSKSHSLKSFLCSSVRKGSIYAHSTVLSVAMPLLDLRHPAIRPEAARHGLVEVKLTTVPGA